MEQLVETLTPSQAAAVVLLWRQYAAARYSAELMAGRAVRLCRELSHELVECRAEVEERTQRHADHAAQLGKAVGGVRGFGSFRYGCGATHAQKLGDGLRRLHVAPKHGK